MYSTNTSAEEAWAAKGTFIIKIPLAVGAVECDLNNTVPIYAIYGVVGVDVMMLLSLHHLIPEWLTGDIAFQTVLENSTDHIM